MVNEKIKNLIEKLERESKLTVDEFTYILENVTDEDREFIRDKAQTIAKSIFGNKVYTRGIVEFSNICKNDCYYCGIR
ncbi:MAG: [Lachnospiraceae bacterium]|nr:[FeFe] hydrogenase H-cluster radical SAM maturase HydE [Lachnospiraceae bacterium]